MPYPPESITTMTVSLSVYLRKLKSLAAENFAVVLEDGVIKNDLDRIIKQTEETIALAKAGKWDDAKEKYGWIMWLALTAYNYEIQSFLSYSESKLGWKLPITRIKELLWEINALKDDFHMAYWEPGRRREDSGSYTT